MRHLLVAALGVLIAGFTTLAWANPALWRAEGWRTDFARSSVELGEIISGGPPRDGIPSIDDPVFASAADIEDIPDREPVIVYPLDNPRAYPLRVLIWHEIANDVVDGMPVAVTYCPLCNAAIVFDRRVGDRVLEFGTTGKLRHSDLVMYDRQTETWWQQFSGEAIAGEFTGAKLKLLPSRIVSFGDFRAAHPDGDVLVPNDASFRDYGRNPYVGYDTAEAPFLYRGDLPDGVPAMAHVVVVRTDGAPIIVTLERIRGGAFESDGYRVSYEGDVASALDSGTIANGRGLPGVRVTKNGADVVHDVTFAFVAQAFHPAVAIFN